MHMLKPEIPAANTGTVAQRHCVIALVMQKYDNYFNENHNFVGSKQAMSGADANSLHTDLNFTVLE